MNFEDQLDEIRILLFEETLGMEKAELIEKMNSRGREIAEKFGITVIKKVIGENHPVSMIGVS